MRVCWFCQQVNGDTATTCVRCGTDISRQTTLPPSAYLERRLPDVVARRNASYRILLLLLPFVVALTLWFWLGFIPAIFKNAESVRRQQLAYNQRVIETALASCRADTGGVPTRRLEVLQQYGVKAGDLTPGADTTRWRGPYLPGGAFPANPYRAGDGPNGWDYFINGSEGSVLPRKVSR